MQMIKTPVNGMKDIMPKEMELRQFILSKIRQVYAKFGFSEIETPNIEHIENLLSDLGWDNEKLIFKIMKRGEKLTKASESGDINNLIDCGLRYDLTVPLSRFFSNNKDSLNLPFKALQIGNVYRADRPQKGRYRQFCQCDLDILGENTNLGEIEVLLATITLLNEIGFDKYNFSIDINDRRILKAICKYSGFDDNDFESVCITLDKLDKIGLDKVFEELKSSNFDDATILKFKEICEDIIKMIAPTNCEDTLRNIDTLYEKIKEFLPIEVIENLKQIINVVKNNVNVKINFNPTLVRGMGYYTGPIFEIKSEKFSGSVGGGGRYDEMIGKFIGTNVSAVGLSIGFERIISIYMDDNFVIPNENIKVAYLIEKGATNEVKQRAISEAMDERKNGKTIFIAEMIKNKKFQRENLEKLGFTSFKDFFNENK